MKINGFEWDDGNTLKCQNHGLTLEEVEEAFSSAKFFEDIKHSAKEKRFYLVSKNKNERYVFVVFTIRFSLKGILARPISARFMHKKEYKIYE